MDAVRDMRIVSGAACAIGARICGDSTRGRTDHHAQRKIAAAIKAIAAT